MKSYEFTLILGDVNEHTPNLEDNIFNAGCDDALINFRNGTVYLDFNRKTPSLKEAVISAIQAIEAMPLNAKVLSIAPEHLVSETDIAKRLNVKKQAVSLWIKGLRRKDIPFPHPFMKLSEASPLWRWPEIIDWSLKNEIITEAEALEEAILIENLNLLLEERVISRKKLKSDLLKEITCR